MNKDGFLIKAREYLQVNDVELEEAQLEKLYLYYSLTLSWGLKMNITTNLDATPYFCENFLDPVLGLLKLRDQGVLISGMADLGAGGGFVGITASVIFADLKYCVLVESIRKKVSFMQMVIRELSLGQTHAVQARAEEVVLNPRLVDTVVSRATWSWEDYELLSERFVQMGMKVVSFEGPKAHKQRSVTPQSVFEYEIKPFDRWRFLYCKNSRISMG